VTIILFLGLPFTYKNALNVSIFKLFYSNRFSIKLAEAFGYIANDVYFNILIDSQLNVKVHNIILNDILPKVILQPINETN